MNNLLEQDVLRTIQLSIQKAIGESLSRYDNPLNKLVGIVIEEHSAEIKQAMSETLEQTLHATDFQTEMRRAFSHMLCRRIISSSDGLLEKTCNELKRDAAFRAKLTLAVSNLVNEHSREQRP